MDKKNNRLKNKLSIGLSLEISPEEYQKLFSDYSGYIHSLYFSPPLEGKYHSRTKISRQFEDPQVVENFYEILRLAKEEGILLDCVLNRPTIREEDVTQALPFIETIGADQITCLQKHVDQRISSFFPNKNKTPNVSSMNFVYKNKIFKFTKNFYKLKKKYVEKLKLIFYDILNFQ